MFRSIEDSPRIVAATVECDMATDELVAVVETRAWPCTGRLNLWRTKGSLRHEEHKLLSTTPRFPHPTGGTEYLLERRLSQAHSSAEQVPDETTSFACEAGVLQDITTIMVRSYDLQMGNTTCWIWSTDTEGINLAKGSSDLFAGDDVANEGELRSCTELDAAP